MARPSLSRHAYAHPYIQKGEPARGFVDSKYTFKLPRPILKNNLPNADQAAVGPWPGVPLDILIIDDSAFIRAFSRIHLSEAGYEVGEVDPTSLFVVLEAIHSHRPALVITDYEMPFCNGETLVRAIREDSVIRDIPILILSAHRESDLVERLSQWDLAGYVVKPIKPEDLVATVRRHLPLSKHLQDAGPSPETT